MDLGVWGDLTILAAVLEFTFAARVFVYVGRLERRTPAALGAWLINCADRTTRSLTSQHPKWVILRRSRLAVHKDSSPRILDV